LTNSSRSPDGDSGHEGRIDLFTPLFIAFVCLALLVGGTSASPISVGAVRIASVPILFVAVMRLTTRRLSRAAIFPLVLLAGAVALLVLQRIALPPDIWTTLPGRDLAVRTYRAANIPLPSMPMSLTPWETWYSLLGLLPPAAAFLFTLTLDSRARLRVALAFVVMALLSLLLGMMQLAGGAAYLHFYGAPGTPTAEGFFANRNHQALFLVSAVPLVAVIAAARVGDRSAAHLRTWGALALAIVLVVAIGVTRSRAGVFLLAPAFLGALVISFRAGGRRGEGRSWLPLALMGASVPIGVLLVVLFNLTPMAERFKDGPIDDLRIEVAQRVAAAGLAYAPFGTGVGSFQVVYNSLETPETVKSVFINHAHNDYTEIWLEAGAPGVLLVALLIGWWAMRLLRLLRTRASNEVQLGVAGAVVVGLALLHSLGDYPLRTASLPVLFGFACALMVPTAQRRALPAEA
jgi:O-antigen ligase